MSKLQSSTTSLSVTTSQSQSFVSWRNFRSAYWPHFPENLKKPFGKSHTTATRLPLNSFCIIEAYLVFGEFMGKQYAVFDMGSIC